MYSLQYTVTPLFFVTFILQIQRLKANIAKCFFHKHNLLCLLIVLLILLIVDVFVTHQLQQSAIQTLILIQLIFFNVDAATPFLACLTFIKTTTCRPPVLHLMTSPEYFNCLFVNWMCTFSSFDRDVMLRCRDTFIPFADGIVCISAVHRTRHSLLDWHVTSN